LEDIADSAPQVAIASPVLHNVETAMDEPVPATPKEAVRVAGDELRYGLRFLRTHGWRLGVWFVFLLLPLWGFASLVGELHENKVFPFDAPVLNILHALATPTLDRFFVLMSQLGYLRGVVPLDLIVLLSLALRRRYREGLFFGIAVAGSAVLNTVAKSYFARGRPDLWLSLTPETTYSFPSGHAMASATLSRGLTSRNGDAGLSAREGAAAPHRCDSFGCAPMVTSLDVAMILP